jgi:hypothetical protein
MPNQGITPINAKIGQNRPIIIFKLVGTKFLFSLYSMTRGKLTDSHLQQQVLTYVDAGKHPKWDHAQTQSEKIGVLSNC